MTWLETGDAYFAALVEAIDRARESVRLESYIYSAPGPGLEVRAALVRAARRGARVRVLVDAFGSLGLEAGYWSELEEAGGESRRFNPLSPRRFSFRDHRKLVVCDGRTAFVGGFNVAAEEAGDGVTRGWRDVAVCVEGPVAETLAGSFDAMYARTEARRVRLSRGAGGGGVAAGRQGSDSVQVIASRPSVARSPLRRALLRDLKDAGSVRIISAYFLPTWALRRTLTGLARRGGEVQIILAGASDVPLSRLAGRALYQRFLRAGIRIFEYQPQVLHSKLFTIGSVVYVGSANLDARSLSINHELVLRLKQPEATAAAARIVASHLADCREIRAEEWRLARSPWEKVKERLAYLLVARLDPYIARRQLARPR